MIIRLAEFTYENKHTKRYDQVSETSQWDWTLTLDILQFERTATSQLLRIGIWRGRFTLDILFYKYIRYIWIENLIHKIRRFNGKEV